MLQNDKRFVFRKYRDFYNKNGFLPKFFNPYNCREITEIAPTITSQCGSTTTSSSVLILETKEIKND